MTQKTISHTLDLVVEECCACGTIFAVSGVLQKNLLRTGDRFYCPVGHPQVYTKSTESKLKEAEQRAAQLAKELKNAREDSQFWQEKAEEHAAAEKAVKKDLRVTRSNLTKTKKRIAAGICPCCHRQFINLQNHMTTQHPDYAIGENEDANGNPQDVTV